MRFYLLDLVRTLFTAATIQSDIEALKATVIVLAVNYTLVSESTYLTLPETQILLSSAGHLGTMAREIVKCVLLLLVYLPLVDSELKE